jgi:hypothetical protein
MSIHVCGCLAKTKKHMVSRAFNHGVEASPSALTKEIRHNLSFRGFGETARVCKSIAS